MIYEATLSIFLLEFYSLEYFILKKFSFVFTFVTCSPESVSPRTVARALQEESQYYITDEIYLYLHVLSLSLYFGKTSTHLPAHSLVCIMNGTIHLTFLY